jgi:hypothetical protein
MEYGWNRCASPTTTRKFPNPDNYQRGDTLPYDEELPNQGKVCVTPYQVKWFSMEQEHSSYMGNADRPGYTLETCAAKAAADPECHPHINFNGLETTFSAGPGGAKPGGHCACWKVEECMESGLWNKLDQEANHMPHGWNIYDLSCP